ncbi:hypothetical protein OE903_21200 [Bacillus sp. B6(2022)]|nr:hypothetical protein [Bacillus sp. B6(2022)]
MAFFGSRFFIGSAAASSSKNHKGHEGNQKKSSSFFTKVRSYSIVYDNDSHSRLYLNMIEEKMHRLFYDQNENGEILPVF